MDYKLIAVDVDGTLTNSRKEITPRTRHALLEAQAKGKRVIIASGRQPLGVYPIAQDLMLERYKGYIMSYNGGKIISCETNRTIINRLFPREYLSDECEVCKTEMVTCDDFLGAVKFDFNKILLAGEPLELDHYQEVLRKRYDGLLDIYKSAPYFLEIMPLGISKGSMLPLLLEQLGIDREELIAFGDNYNDMTMIGYAGMGVAMGNGEAEVKKIANYVCESNDEDGIAKTLEKFVL